MTVKLIIYCLAKLHLLTCLLSAGEHIYHNTVWRSEDKFGESVLPFHTVGSPNWTQVVRLGSSCLSLLSHLTGPPPPSLKSGLTVSFRCGFSSSDEDLWMEVDLAPQTAQQHNLRLGKWPSDHTAILVKLFNLFRLQKLPVCYSLCGTYMCCVRGYKKPKEGLIFSILRCMFFL